MITTTKVRSKITPLQEWRLQLGYVIEQIRRRKGLLRNPDLIPSNKQESVRRQALRDLICLRAQARELMAQRTIMAEASRRLSAVRENILAGTVTARRIRALDWESTQVIRILKAHARAYAWAAEASIDEAYEYEGHELTPDGKAVRVMFATHGLNDGFQHDVLLPLLDLELRVVVEGV